MYDWHYIKCFLSCRVATTPLQIPSLRSIKVLVWLDLQNLVYKIVEFPYTDNSSFLNPGLTVLRWEEAYKVEVLFDLFVSQTLLLESQGNAYSKPPWCIFTEAKMMIALYSWQFLEEGIKKTCPVVSRNYNWTIMKSTELCDIHVSVAYYATDTFFMLLG